MSGKPMEVYSRGKRFLVYEGGAGAGNEKRETKNAPNDPLVIEAQVDLVSEFCPHCRQRKQASGASELKLLCSDCFSCLPLEMRYPIRVLNFHGINPWLISCHNRAKQYLASCSRKEGA